MIIQVERTVLTRVRLDLVRSEVKITINNLSDNKTAQLSVFIVGSMVEINRFI